MKCLALICFLWMCPEYAIAEVWKVDERSSEVSFLALGNPGFIKIRGEGAKLTGMLTNGKGVLTVFLDALKTGMKIRDRHMKGKYLQVDKYPKAFLTVENLKRKGKYYYVWGKLQIKKETTKVSFIAEIKEKKDNYEIIEADFSISMKDYPSIGVPQWLGITVAKKIDIDVKFKAVRVK